MRKNTLGKSDVQRNSWDDTWMLSSMDRGEARKPHP